MGTCWKELRQALVELNSSARENHRYSHDDLPVPSSVLRGFGFTGFCSRASDFARPVSDLEVSEK